jgi:hypothetical protein
MLSAAGWLLSQVIFASRQMEFLVPMVLKKKMWMLEFEQVSTIYEAPNCDKAELFRTIPPVF